MEPVDALLEALRDPDQRVGFLTGAGISVASGIPTFRGNDPGAVWANDVMEKGTRRYFERDPVGSWTWYLGRFDKVWQVGPNAAHHACRALEERCGIWLVTQNIDGLHQAAGSTDCIAIHGSAHAVRCSRVGCEHGAPRGTLAWPTEAFDAFRADPSEARLPTCPSCGALLRAHVLWFDETYGEHEGYGFRRFQEELPTITTLVFVGTSFSVGITEMALSHVVFGGCQGLVVDPFLDRAPHPRLGLIRERSETFLPSIVRQVLPLNE